MHGIPYCARRGDGLMLKRVSDMVHKIFAEVLEMSEI